MLCLCGRSKCPRSVYTQTQPCIHGCVGTPYCMCRLEVPLQPCCCGTWSHGAAAASPLLGCWIQHDTTSFNRHHKHQITAWPGLSTWMGGREECLCVSVRKTQREQERTKERLHTYSSTFQGLRSSGLHFLRAFLPFQMDYRYLCVHEKTNMNSKQKDTKVLFQS